jgi:hypothetical protein
MKLTAQLELNDVDLETLVRRIVREEVANVTGIPTGPSRQEPKCFFVSSRHPGDVLRIVEAPDTSAGVRQEPHWRVLQDMQPGDYVVFRASQEGSIVGYGVVDWTEKGEHRHDPGTPAIKHWIRDAVRFQQKIPDSEFHDLFVRLDNGAAGFSLFTRQGHYAHKTYAYPITRELFDGVLQLKREGV